MAHDTPPPPTTIGNNRRSVDDTVHGKYIQLRIIRVLGYLEKLVERQ